MDYTIKHIITERELDDALLFARRIFADLHCLKSEDEERADWRGHMVRNNDLLLYAEMNGEVVGFIFGFIEENRK